MIKQWIPELPDYYCGNLYLAFLCFPEREGEKTDFQGILSNLFWNWNIALSTLLLRESNWVKVAGWCPTLFDPMGYTVHGILQARVLTWVAIPFSRGSSKPRSPVLQADSLPAEPPGKPKNTGVGSLSFSSRYCRPKNQTGLSCIVGGFFISWATREAPTEYRKKLAKNSNRSKSIIPSNNTNDPGKQ